MNNMLTITSRSRAWLPGMALVCLLANPASALEFARPFGDFMVLPHDQPIPVWGNGDPGSEIHIHFAGDTTSTRCDSEGRWRVTLTEKKPSNKGDELKLTSGNQELILHDILVGEIWLCSGQSNMDFPLARATGGLADAASAGEFPAIRLFDRSGAPTDARPYDEAVLARLNVRKHFVGKWSVASARSAASISAVAWWTAKAIHLKKRIPIGVVENAVGGSGAEAWLPLESLNSRTEYQALLGDGWLDHPKIGSWARERAKLNLASHPSAMHPFKPGFLFESGVRDWASFPFAGVLWYQGETNAEIADDTWNERLIEDLVSGWRAALKQKDLPFYMIQLPRIGGGDPLRAHWPEFRAVQERAARKLPGVQLIVTQDLGWDSPDVHPPDKRPVAERLAAAILK